MKISPTYRARPEPLTAEEQEAQEAAKIAAAAKRKAELEAQEAATAKANGATVSLSERSLSALAQDDQRIRRNIQWGVVRGMFLYTLFMIPVALIAALIIAGLGHS